MTLSQSDLTSTWVLPGSKQRGVTPVTLRAVPQARGMVGMVVSYSFSRVFFPSTLRQ